MLVFLLDSPFSLRALQLYCFSLFPIHWGGHPSSVLFFVRLSLITVLPRSPSHTDVPSSDRGLRAISFSSTFNKPPGVDGDGSHLTFLQSCLHYFKPSSFSPSSPSHLQHQHQNAMHQYRSEASRWSEYPTQNSRGLQELEREPWSRPTGSTACPFHQDFSMLCRLLKMRSLL